MAYSSFEVKESCGVKHVSNVDFDADADVDVDNCGEKGKMTVPRA